MKNTYAAGYDRHNVHTPGTRYGSSAYKNVKQYNDATRLPKANTFHDRSSSALIVKISQPVSCNIRGTWYKVLISVLPLVSPTATTKKGLSKGQAW